MIKEFYKENEFHMCRFCGIGIQNLKERVVAEAVQRNDGSWAPAVKVKILRPNALFAHGEIPLRGGSKFTFNGCIECVKKVNYKDFMRICKNDASMLQYMNRSVYRPKMAASKTKVFDIATLSKRQVKNRS